MGIPTGRSPARSSNAPSLRTGYFILVLTVIISVFGSFSILFSAFLPETGIVVLDLLAKDNHYKYFFILLVPTTVYFVIANWVGWQYYRNS